MRFALVLYSSLLMAELENLSLMEGFFGAGSIYLRLHPFSAAR